MTELAANVMSADARKRLSASKEKKHQKEQKSNPLDDRGIEPLTFHIFSCVNRLRNENHTPRLQCIRIKPC